MAEERRGTRRESEVASAFIVLEVLLETSRVRML